MRNGVCTATKEGSGAGQSCIRAKFRPFFAGKRGLEEAEDSAVVLAKDGDECPVRVEAVGGEGPIDSGWLGCHLNHEFLPWELLSPYLFQGPPTVLSSREMRSGQEWVVEVRVAAWPLLVNTTWHRIHKTELGGLQCWTLTPHSARSAKSPYFLIKTNEPSAANWFTETVITATFSDPQSTCTDGNYSFSFCNIINCTTFQFTIKTAPVEATGYGPNCAVALFTFNVTDIEVLRPDREIPRPESPPDRLFPILATASALTLLLFAAALLAIRHRRKRAKTPPTGPPTEGDSLGLSDWRGSPTKLESSPLLFPNTDTYTAWIDSFIEESGVYPVPSDEIEVVRPLGEGAFGKVFLVRRRHPDQDVTYTVLGQHSDSDIITPLPPSDTKYDKPSNEGDYINCSELPHEMAMKQLKWITPEKIEELRREAKVMVTLCHPNIVSFYGVCLRPSLSLLFEYMEEGDLVSWLRARNPAIADPNGDGTEELGVGDLLGIAGQVGNGLAYLAERRLVHRDLAARNCLVSRLGIDSGLLVKITDFGMARSIGLCTDYYRMGGQTVVPLRWLPPESLLYRKFTVESDVWSLGVCLWEIFSLGQIPWSQFANEEVVAVVKEGRRLPRPDTCPLPIYQRLILPCWKLKPSERLTAADAVVRVQELREDTQGYCTLLTSTKA